MTSYCPVKSGRFINRNKLSPALKSICGKSHLYKQQVVQAILLYIKEKKLQNSESIIVCDPKLRQLTTKKKVHLLEVHACIDENLS